MLIPSFRDYPIESFLVYNPTTRLSRNVSATNANSVVAFALAFDPSKSPHYKLVFITATTLFCTNPHDQIHTYQIEVYESEIHAWKLRLGPFTFPKQLSQCGECWGAGVYCNGSIYWEMCDNIVYYDIAQNEFKTFSMPHYQSYKAGEFISGSISCLQEANGRLYKSRYLRRDDSILSIEVFELEMNDDRSSSWLLRYEGTISHHEPSLAFQLRFIKGSYDTEMCSAVFNIYGKIIAYSFLDSSYKLLVDMNRHPIPISFGRHGSSKMYEFVECLAVV
ncbi:F-box protein At5g07610-like [Salvia hispanica]|nr:F-box protein At5g07610-like [Salvia hispanica]